MKTRRIVLALGLGGLMLSAVSRATAAGPAQVEVEGYAGSSVGQWTCGPTARASYGGVGGHVRFYTDDQPAKAPAPEEAPNAGTREPDPDAAPEAEVAAAAPAPPAPAELPLDLRAVRILVRSRRGWRAPILHAHRMQRDPLLPDERRDPARAAARRRSRGRQLRLEVLRSPRGRARVPALGGRQ